MAVAVQMTSMHECLAPSCAEQCPGWRNHCVLHSQSYSPLPSMSIAAYAQEHASLPNCHSSLMICETGS